MANVPQVWLDMGDLYDNLNAVEQRNFVEFEGWPLRHLLNPLPPLQSTTGHRTVTPSGSSGPGRGPYFGSLREWARSDLFGEIFALRKSMTPNERGDVAQIEQTPSRSSRKTWAMPEVLQVGNEKGVEGRFHENVHAAVLRALHQKNEQNRGFEDVIIGDDVIADRDARRNLANYKTMADFTICMRSSHKPICVGEVKTPWNYDIFTSRERHMVDPEALSSFRKKLGTVTHSVEVERLYSLQWTGQIAQYMKVWGLKYGYLCTYSELILLRQVKDGNTWFLEHSPIFRSSQRSRDFTRGIQSAQDNVSIREALLCLINLSLQEGSTDLYNDDDSWFPSKKHDTRFHDNEPRPALPGQQEKQKDKKARLQSFMRSGAGGSAQSDSLADCMTRLSVKDPRIQLV